MTDGAAFRRPSASPTLRIVQSGALLVLDAAATRLLGEAVAHVRLLYDRDTRRIGLMPTDGSDPDGFALAIASGTRTVGVGPFVDRYRIPVGVAFPVQRDGDMVVARIPESVPDGFVDGDRR